MGRHLRLAACVLVAGMMFVALVGCGSSDCNKGDGDVQNLGTLGGDNSRAYDINDSGQVVGESELANGDEHAFLWEPARGAMRDLGTLGGAESAARGINASGQVVGEAITSSGDTHAFVWDPGTGVMTDLGTLGGAHSRAMAINASGTIVGEALNASGEWRAFISNHLAPAMIELTSSGLSDLGALGGRYSSAFGINDAGQVVGLAETAASDMHHAFLWNPATQVIQFAAGGMIDLGTLGGEHSRAYDINEAGLITGRTDLATEDDRGYVWNPESGMTTLASLGGNYTSPRAINNVGQIAGRSFNRDGNSRACVWQVDGYMPAH